MTSEYRALVTKVEAAAAAIGERRARDLTCSAGCSRCCEAWLSVSAVEAEALQAALTALPAPERERVRARGQRELAREARGETQERCAMLDDAGRCSVYEARPLVCRTQGHALRYPAGLIPVAAVKQRTTRGDVTWCPLNYSEAAPASEDILDAERIDQILSVVATRHAHTHDTTPTQRSRLSGLAAETDVLHDETSRRHESGDAQPGPV